MRALVLVAVVAAGCAHPVVFRSEPAGADVLVDGAKVGVTPLTWQEPPGAARVIDVEVKHGERSERFAFKKEGWSTDTIAAVGAPCVGGSALAAAGGLAAFFASIALVPCTGGLSIFCGWAAFPVVAAGVLGFWPAVITTGLVALTMGRIGPDEVFVDFAKGEVQGKPTNLVGPPAGAPPPLPPPPPSSGGLREIAY